MRATIVIGVAVFVVALAALLGLRSGSALHPPFPKERAVHAATSDRGIAAFLQRHPWTRARVIALDRSHWRVTFTDGPRYVLDAAIGPAGKVDAVEAHPASLHPPGSATLWTPALLVLLAAVFVAVMTTVPLRSLRNLDALVIGAGFTLAALLLDTRLYGVQTLVGDAVLAYIAIRCTRIGFGFGDWPPIDPAYRRLLAKTKSTRVLTVLAAALTVAGALLTVTSTQPSDVATANLAGATLLNHGQLPYGNLPAIVVHGDTYPLLSYVLYMPFAAFAPVRNVFDSLDGALWLNAIALLGTAALLARLAGREHLIAWLAFPPVLLAATTGGNDVPTALFVAFALATFARPLLSSAVLTLAGWVKVVPAVALAVWAARLPRRSALQVVAVAALILAAGLAALIALGGTGAVGAAWDAMRFQFVRGSWFSLWQQTDTRGPQVVFQAATLGFAAAIVVELLRGDRQVDLRRAAALAAALVALLQLGANYWTYAYLPWLMPFVLVALFPTELLRSRLHAQPAP